MTTRVCRPKTTPSYPPAIPNHPVSVLISAGGGSGTPVIHGGGGGSGATVKYGVTWTDVRPDPSMNSVIATAPFQAQHIIEHGAGNAWPSNASPPSEGTWNSQLDPMMQRVRDAGAIEKCIIGNKAPRWMVADPSGPDDQRPTNGNFGNFATICAQAAARYTDFQWFSVWNEYKGFDNAALNRPDWENYKTFYDGIRNAVKAVRPTMKVGGPYTTNVSFSYQRSETTLTAPFPGGFWDVRWMNAMDYFIANSQFDFLSFDGGIENDTHNVGGVYFGADPQQQIQKFAALIQWIRGHGGAAATVPIIGFETYVQVAGYPPGGASGGGYGYSQAQLEDLYINMMESVQAVSPLGPVYFNSWFHPAFWPLLVNKANDFVWANTESPYRAKVASYHATGVYP